MTVEVTNEVAQVVYLEPPKQEVTKLMIQVVYLEAELVEQPRVFVTT